MKQIWSVIAMVCMTGSVFRPSTAVSQQRAASPSARTCVPGKPSPTGTAYTNSCGVPVTVSFCLNDEGSTQCRTAPEFTVRTLAAAEVLDIPRRAQSGQVMFHACRAPWVPTTVGYDEGTKRLFFGCDRRAFDDAELARTLAKATREAGVAWTVLAIRMAPPSPPAARCMVLVNTGSLGVMNDAKRLLMVPRPSVGEVRFVWEGRCGTDGWLDGPGTLHTGSEDTESGMMLVQEFTGRAQRGALEGVVAYRAGRYEIGEDASSEVHTEKALVFSGGCVVNGSLATLNEPLPVGCVPAEGAKVRARVRSK